MEILEKNIAGHEKVLFGEDQEAGYRGIIAIHNTALGPALGGTRLWNYATDAEGLTDVLRLSRGMTYKNALAGLPLGGGKSIIFAPDKIRDREKLFRAHGRFIILSRRVNVKGIELVIYSLFWLRSFHRYAWTKIASSLQ